ncbi:dihydrolipoyl dehydrogenase [Thiohalobacter sp. IOR34]|uniref:dihydrolipoyl dehydrogenase n=1 Tax=Thiohalobacter sp. IOR34 TaxID=3057176 RepID=UPI0025B1941D|nr:dihydrolipoyl dehydrogenase [Thiohalobacter sp. IOR34]WJW75754.1 dihydrolipoyl dehydrogenase [Thiohalobacter sp. IOR34]
MSRDVDVAIIGAGSAGLYALSQVRRATDNWVLIDGGELGTTCARVGCMPSKALIQVAEDFQRRQLFRREGIEGGDGLSVDLPAALEHVQDLRDLFVEKVLANSIDQMDESRFIAGQARFVAPDTLEVDGQTLKAKSIIVATGSRPSVPEAWRAFGDRVLTTDELFELEDLPASLAVIGLGVIGLELGQALARLGVEVAGFEMGERIGGMEDPAVSRVAVEIIGKEFPLHLGAAAEIEAEADGRLRVTAGEQSVVVERVLACMGRMPNVEGLGLEVLGVERDARGVPLHDRHSMQVGSLPVYLAGDVTGERPLLHEAGDEGRIAGFNAVHERPRSFARKTPLAITFSDPNLVMVGAALDELDLQAIAIGEVRLGPLGRALIMGKNKGLLRVYADRRDGRLRGAALCGPRAENLGHLLALAIGQGLTVFDMLKQPFYHPTLEEGLQAALYDLKGQFETSDEVPVELSPLD